MAREFLTKWSDPEYIRGLVLSRAVDVEIAMDDCILAHFEVASSKESLFRREFLGRRGIGPFARFNVIREAMKMHAVGNPYDQVNHENVKLIFLDTRDVFAHTTLDVDRDNPFGIQLVQKVGNTELYGKQRLEMYFLKCSRIIKDLERLELEIRNPR